MENVYESVMESLEAYKKSGDDPRFMILPIDRARRLLDDIILKKQLAGVEVIEELFDAAREQSDQQFSNLMYGMSFSGVRILVLTTQIVLGGWAVEQIENQNGC